jgi:hypothetical protein
MNRTTLITAAVAAIVCGGLLLLQSGRNQRLAEQFDTDTASVAKLELRAQSPGIVPGEVSALNTNAPRPGSIEAAVAEARALSTPQERIDRAVERIEALVADIGDVDQSPAELFKVLPDLLRMVQDLDLDEMIAVAEKLDAPLSMGDTDGKGAMKMILMMLAAEQDPERVLQNPDIMKDRGLRGTVLAALARKDMEAAKSWMENSDMKEQERKQFEQMMAMQLLRTDFAAGLDLIRDNEGSMYALAMIGRFGLPEGTMPQVIAALDEPANEKLRPQLLGMIMNSSMIEGGIESGRQRIEELGLSDEEVTEYLNENIDSLVQIDPAGAFQWLSDAQTPEQYAETFPDAFESWTRQDYNAAGAWLGEMDPSPEKDSAINSYAGLIADLDPKAATIWATEIQNEDLRTQSLQIAARKWVTADADAANAWLSGHGIDLPPAPTQTIEPNAIDFILEEVRLDVENDAP